MANKAEQNKCWQDVSTSICVGVAATALLLIGAHYFFRNAGILPYFAADDSLYNISFSLANRGIFGFPAGPVQPGETLLLRDDIFYNHGPWAYYLVALLDWIFGSSIVLSRAIHPLALCVACVFAHLTFRRHTRSASLVLAGALFIAFWYAHWPMMRPDPVVAAFATGTLFFTTRALETDRWQFWFLGAFSAASAVATHQIAFAIPLFFASAWLYSAVRDQTKYWRASGQAIIGGFAFAFVLYLVAIDFKVDETIKLLLFYRETVGDGPSSSYLTQSARQAAFYWTPLHPVAKGVFAFGLLTAVFWVALVRRVAPEKAGDTYRLLLPPIAMLSIYIASLGLYPNVHTGYVILVHILLAWISAGAFALIPVSLFARPGRMRTILMATKDMLAILWVAAVLFLFMVRPPHLISKDQSFVAFDDLLREASSYIARNASAWGTIQFGTYSGRHFDLVQYADGVFLAKTLNEQERHRVAPDYLVLAKETQFIFTGDTILNAESRYAPSRILPGVRYRLHAIVYAPPYGDVRIYKRANETAAAPQGAPMVSVNFYGSEHWARKPARPIDIDFVADVPSELTYSIFNDPKKHTERASETMVSRASVNPGFYLFELSACTGDSKEPGALSISNRKHDILTQTPLADDFTLSPYFVFENKTWAIFNHKGGPIWVSRYADTPCDGFAVSSVASIDFETPFELHAIRFPALDTWSVLPRVGKTADRSDNAIRVTGDASAGRYQFSSPQIAIPPHTRIELTLPFASLNGSFKVGVLGKWGGNWLAEPQPAGGTISFDTGAEKSIEIVVLNSNPAALDAPAAFDIGPGEIRAYRRGHYVDTLNFCAKQRLGDEERQMSEPDFTTEAISRSACR